MTIQRVLAAVCALAMLTLSLCACSNKGPLEDPVDYCSITRGSDGLYNFSVVNFEGDTFLSRTDIESEPLVAAVRGSWISIQYIMPGKALGRAIFCNPADNSMSVNYENVLAVKDNLVVYTEHLTGHHQIFIRDGIDEAEYFDFVTLEDADPTNPGITGNFNSDGDLSVTYRNNGAEKNIVIDLP